MELSNCMPGISCSLQGILKAQAMMNKSAQNVATGEGELAQETVNQITAEKSQKANVNMIKTRDEMLEELMHMR